jgi:hypothetical protein
MVQDPLFRRGKDPAGLRFILEGFQDNTPLEGLGVKTSGSTTPLLLRARGPFGKGVFDFLSMVTE